MKTCVSKQLNEILSKHYDIGELLHFEIIPRGYVNTSYRIDTIFNGTKKRFVFVEYIEGKREAELAFEHSMFKYISECDFRIVPRIVYTKDNKTYVKKITKVGYENSKKPAFYAVFEFIGGHDKYTWINPTCCDEELSNAASLLAKFHYTMSNFHPKEQKHEAETIEFLTRAAVNIEKTIKKDGRTVFDTYLRENKDFILGNIKRTLRAIDTREYRELVNLVIHGDFHPGNMKFDNENIVGLFDFGWSRFDSRCYDIALALVYFCVSWLGKDDGKVRLNEVSTFLVTYQNTLGYNNKLGPLNSTELKYLPYLIHAGNIYVLNWTVNDFYSKEVDAHEYLRYLQHSVNTTYWLDNVTNWHELERLISECQVSH